MQRLKKGVVADERSVSIEDDYEIEYWLKEFNTTKPKLLAAIALAGADADKVKRQLKK